MKVSQEAGAKSKALVPDIEKTTQLIKEISAASMEQKTGAEQINLAMQQLNMITQENASSSDELTQSSDQLANLADNLHEAVNFFKIGEEEQAKPNFKSEEKPASSDEPKKEVKQAAPKVYGFRSEKRRPQKRIILSQISIRILI